MATETLNPQNVRRRALKLVVAALCAEAGFVSAEDSALETLTEMLQSCVTEMGRSAQAYCELAGRIQPMLSDVVMALVEMGLNVESLPGYAKRTNKTALIPPGMSLSTPQPRTLQAGDKKAHPSHIPDYMPQFPDPHTYIKTQTEKEPITEYEIIREKAASQKRDVERALTRFIAKTGETESLFQDDPYAYPLIAVKPKHQPYLEALLTQDEDLDSLDDEAAKPQQLIESPKKPPEKEPKPPEVSEESNDLQTTPPKPQDPNASGSGLPSDPLDSDSQIDNPYLRAIKMPKLKFSGKKYKPW